MGHMSRSMTTEAVAAVPPATPALVVGEAGNEALVRRFYAAFNNGNLDAFDEFLAADFIDHNPVPGAAAGAQGVKDTMGMLSRAFPDMKIEIEFTVADGDRVAVYTSGRGSHAGPFLGVPATNRPVFLHATDIWLVRDGKLAEAWHVEEFLQAMVQIGALGS